MTRARALRDLGEDPVWVRMTGISKRYGDQLVLDDLDVCFRPGRITALLGPNGAGKTTLINSLLGLVHLDAGEVSISGEVVGVDPGYRVRFGYMPQLPRFPDNLTGWHLVNMLDDVRGFQGEPDETLLDEFRLRDEMMKPVRTLSGGTRQKLNAALAFRYGAPVLVLDEPTAGLDPVAAAVLKDHIRREKERGKTVLLSSHELGALEALADDVVFLVEGRVLFEGEVALLLEQSGEAGLEGAMVALLLEHRSRNEASVDVDDREVVA